MEENRPLRQAEQAEKAANELLLEECREEVKKLKKERNKAASTKKEKSFDTMPAIDRVSSPPAAHVPYPAAIAYDPNDAMKSEEMAIVDDGCNTSLHGMNSIKAITKKEDSEEEAIVEDGFSSSSHSNDSEEVNSMKAEASRFE